MTSLELMEALRKQELAEKEAKNNADKTETYWHRRGRLIVELKKLVSLIDDSKVKFFPPSAIIENLRIGLSGSEFADEVKLVERFTISRDEADVRVRGCGIRVTSGTNPNSFTVEVGALPLLSR